MEQMKFSLLEMLSLFGVFQCVYILVYVSFRTLKISHVILPLLYFFVLGAAFLSDFARLYVSSLIPAYDLISWSIWSYVLPLGVLLVFQMAKIRRLPPLPVWGVLALVPAALAFSLAMTEKSEICLNYNEPCPELREWLAISGLIAGALSLLVIWAARSTMSEIREQSAGRERYWLILSLVILNICYLAFTAMRLGGDDYDANAVLLRTVLGLTFCYVVSTSLFRIYPISLILATNRNKKKMDGEPLAPEQHALISKIDDLLALQKVYHEPTYSRSDMAKELNVSEATLSHVINTHYSKSFPQILNERRIQDAKLLLLETGENIKIIAQEVGFNSLPSFNRAFKEVEGRSPSDYRKHMIK